MRDTNATLARIASALPTATHRSYLVYSLDALNQVVPLVS